MRLPDLDDPGVGCRCQADPLLRVDESGALNPTYEKASSTSRARRKDLLARKVAIHECSSCRSASSDP